MGAALSSEDGGVDSIPNREESGLLGLGQSAERGLTGACAKRKLSSTGIGNEAQQEVEEEGRVAANEQFAERARKVWECAVCLGIAFPHREPILLPCAHVYCLACIEEVRKNAHGGKATCPQCVRPFAPRDLVKLQTNAFAFRTLLNLSTPCPLECPWIGDVADLTAHWDTCTKAKCSDCGAVIKPPALMEDHQGVCPKVPVSCGNDGCDQLVPRDALQDHASSCDHRMISCSEPGCSCKLTHIADQVKRKDLAAHLSLVSYHHGLLKALLPPLDSGNGCCAYQQLTISLPNALVAPTDAERQDPLWRVQLPSATFFAGPVKLRIDSFIYGSGSVRSGPVIVDTRVHHARLAFSLRPVASQQAVGPWNRTSYVLLLQLGTSGRFFFQELLSDAFATIMDPASPWIHVGPDDKRAIKVDLRIHLHSVVEVGKEGAGAPSEIRGLRKAPDGSIDGEAWSECLF
ncbi:hypothetical protein DFJ74DRAFT_643762 [Hyaloraphidium curvatum]|nr:hypothetical protein DFJ74DRAFT_643762 [Hyaloraphidium curvatum]